MRNTWAITLVISALIVAACSGGGTLDRGYDSGQSLNGYLASGPNTAMFVWWAESDGALTGSIYRVERGLLQDSGVSSTEVSFTATREVDQLTLTIEGLFGLSSILAGNLTDASLLLFIPDDDGSIVEVTLRPATLAQYNGVVERIRGQVEAERDAAYQAELRDLQATIDAREAAIQARKAERLAYERSCLEHNGIIAKEGGLAFSTGTCIVHYAGGDYDGNEVAINLDGSWDQEAEEFARQICRDLAAAGFNAIYHEDTGVCEGDAP